MTSAAGAIRVLRDGTVLAAPVLAFAFEIIRVTGGAARLVSGLAPRHSSAHHLAVAAVTAPLPPVITGLAPLRPIAEAGWRPAIRGMARVTLFGRVPMPPGLAVPPPPRQ